MSKLFEQFKKETGDNWCYKNGWDFAPDEIITQHYIGWLEEKLTSDNSDYESALYKILDDCIDDHYRESVKSVPDIVKEIQSLNATHFS